ncbi:LRR receptor-like serine/threonine-protein kinase RPK2 [Herrania umbratica]|uniref:non-specific serine/threonine protein kinase n=1 Tax=Herrania umbratica TaxID=108875 RepID=A0A6J1BFS6_9ROSI|nr:LRR receptor-like serine/threonine-protein kinase RPK2 [Herrania umbratica]XP_021297974.1 LRR receptor-like serine/threonine-protein kinase RPK2 [Herrania umbratica]
MTFLWFLLFSFSFTLSKSAPDSDSAILLSLKKSIFHDPSNLLSSWNPSTTHCSWFGVRCANFSDKVTALSLAQNGFSGEIPADIGDLKFLEVLELQGNNFSGQIPAEISYLPSLSLLNLSFNSFSGYIPDRLIGNGSLKVIDLSNNMFSGRISLDNSSRCEFLTHLKLSNNYLVENIPPEIRNCKNLRTLLVDGNILEGKIPVEIGQMTELRVLDVSRNSLTDVIPKEIASCKKLSAVVLTNLENFGSEEKTSSMDSFRGEFNAFDGGVPLELLFLSSLQVLWAPRANLGGRLPAKWSEFCSLRVLNLGQNYFGGVVPENIGMCKNLTFLDLSSNNLLGYLPWQLHVPCMTYFNISRNNISGNIPGYRKGSCAGNRISYGLDSSLIELEDTRVAYANLPFWGSKMWLLMDEDFAIVHDLSWNRFTGLVPMFSIGDQLLARNSKFSYRLSLNNNMLNGSSHRELIPDCGKMKSVSVNLSANQIGGMVQEAFFLDCLQLTEFEAAYNQIEGSIDSRIGNLMMLQVLDFRGNRLFGSLPDQLGKLKNLRWISLGENDLTGEIPSELGQLASLKFLDLSHNSLTGSIPASLTNATNLETLLLNHNQLSGEIPSSFSLLSHLTVLDLSFNDLSGPIPNFQHQTNCTAFRGNSHLHQCLSAATPPVKPGAPGKFQKERKFKSFIIATITSASVLLCMVPMIVVVCQFRRRKFRRLGPVKGKVVVTFADAPNELTYDNVASATGNFSIRNLIGTGGFGSTYKAELVPGYHVAVKRLSIGRFQGVQQFDAEIRTLGRVRHKNLVTLIGYYVGENEMFLVYNYLSGGNLETFIHDKSGKNVQWSVIYKITVDIAQALAYLHYSCVPRIVHRDIKPSNILLDENLNAFLSDFGLARLLEVSETHATTDVAGTFGYVAPEYATTCRVSDKADVYSFGVVLLELLSGKKSIDPSFSEFGNGFNIVEWTKWLIKERRPSELFSAELWENGPRENLLGMLRLASACTAEALSIRPRMKQVLEKLKQLKS